MLREYLEAMRALWTQEEAEYHGEFVNFGPSWAWPKPVHSRTSRSSSAPAGTEKNFDWIARTADGWITTPRDTTSRPVKLLHDTWAAAGRDGPRRSSRWTSSPTPTSSPAGRELGVTEVLFGLPDSSPDEIAGYIERLAGKLNSLV